MQNNVVDVASEYKVSWEGGTIDVPVQSNVDYTATIEQDGEWLSIIETKAMHSSTITLKAEENTGLTPRTALLRLTAPDGAFWTVTITQGASAKQVAVHVATPGTLSEVISEEDLHKIINLKISGKLNDNDLSLLRGMEGYYSELVWQVEELDLSEMTTTTNETGVIFRNMPALTKVIMPLHVETISDGAFTDCAKLEIIDFGTNSGILTLCGHASQDAFTGNLITSGAFARCTALKSVTLPDNLEDIQAGAFAFCTSLEEVVFPESCNVRTLKPSYAPGGGVVDLGDGSMSGHYMGQFIGCTSLGTLVLPKSLRRIEGQAFVGSPFRGIVFPEGLTSIETEYLFSGCSRLEEVTLPSIVTEFAPHMFSGCSSLTKIETTANIVYYPDYLFAGANPVWLKLDPGIEYGAYVFANMNLESLEFPDGFKVIPAGMFAGWKNLKNVNLTGIEEIGMNAFDECMSITTLVLPATLKRVWTNAFVCPALESVEIQSDSVVFGIKNAVVSLPGVSFAWGGPGFHIDLPDGATVSYDTDSEHYSFKTPSMLPGRTVKWPDGSHYDRENVSVRVLIGNNVVSVTGRFGDDRVTDIAFDTASRCEEFGIAAGTGITSISLPSALRRLSLGAFTGLKLKSFNLPENLEYIGEEAFRGCSELRRITIPAKVHTIDNGAFVGCSKLYEITIPSSSQLNLIGSYAFTGCPELDPFVLNGAESMTVRQGALYFAGDTRTVTLGRNIKRFECVSRGTDRYGDPVYYFEGSGQEAAVFTTEEGSALEELLGYGEFASDATIHLPATMKVIGDDVFQNFTGTIYIPAAAYDSFQATWGDKDWWSRVVKE